MTNDDDMRIGELAERAGVSVRTLHHYDEIGLLRPRAGGQGAQRRYGSKELQRLQQIRSLQTLGLSLAEIASCLDAPSYRPTLTLRQHLNLVGEEIEAAQTLRRRLQGLLEQFEGRREPSREELLLALEATLAFERHYTPEQLETLREQASEVGQARIREVEQEWRDLFEAFGLALEQGQAPGDPVVRPLAEKAQALVDEFTRGDPGITRAVARVNSEDRVAQKYMKVPDEVWQFMADARAALQA